MASGKISQCRWWEAETKFRELLKSLKEGGTIEIGSNSSLQLLNTYI